MADPLFSGIASISRMADSTIRIDDGRLTRDVRIISAI
jgi:hypothetical protein